MSASKTHGTAFKVDISATLTLIAGAKNISFPGVHSRTTETTSHDSGGWAEHLATLKEGGEFSVGFVWDDSDTGQAYLATNAGGAAQTFQIGLPNSGTEFDFDAIIKDIDHDAEVDGAYGGTVTFLVTGAITRTP